MIEMDIEKERAKISEQEALSLFVNLEEEKFKKILAKYQDLAPKAKL